MLVNPGSSNTTTGGEQDHLSRDGMHRVDCQQAMLTIANGVSESGRFLGPFLSGSRFIVVLIGCH